MATATRRETIEDYVSLSFADVLTCVLGASIALFLIFIAIIKLTEADSVAAGLSQGTKVYMANSIQAELNEGFATATLRVLTTSLSSFDVTTSAQESRESNDLRISHNGNEYLGFIDQYNQGFRYNIIYTLATPIEEQALVQISLQVGGMSYKCEIQLQENRARGQTVKIFTIGPKLSNFVTSDHPYQCSPEMVT